jgi:3-hydroxy-3-methylglutaryl CoA synthase
MPDQKLKFDFREKTGLEYLRTKSPAAFVPTEVQAKAFGDSAEDIAKLGGKGFRWPTFSQSNTTVTADLVYAFVKDLEREDRLAKLKQYPITRWGFLTESGSDGGIPDLEYAFGVVTSKLLGEDETKYRPIVESVMRKSWILSPVFNCGSGGIMLDVYLPPLALERKSSAAFVSVDTSVYDRLYSGKNTHWTAGSGGTLGWLTPDASVMYFDRKASATYNLNEFGFTKYWSKHVPKTHGIASQILYDYIGIKAYLGLEEGVDGRPGYDLSGIEFINWHPPFIEQPKVFYTIPYVHSLRAFDPAKLAQIEANPAIGPEVLNGFHGFAHMLEQKLTALNRNDERLSDARLIETLEKDTAIRGHLEWLKKVRRFSPEFHVELKAKQVDASLSSVEEEGNMYANGTFGMVRGLLERGSIYPGMPGLVGFFGSGGTSSLFGSAIAGEPSVIRRDHLFVDNNGRVSLNKDQYLELYEALLQEEAKRTTTGEDLIQKDLKFLGRDTLTPGFHMRKRDRDGTGEWVFVDEDGRMTDVARRY